MKKVIYLAMFILGMTMLCSCSKDKNNDNEDVVTYNGVPIAGKWEMYKQSLMIGSDNNISSGMYYIIFKNNGTITDISHIFKKEVLEGTYSFTDDKLIMDFPNDNHIEYTIYDFTADQLCLGYDKPLEWYRKVYNYDASMIVGKWTHEFYEEWQKGKWVKDDEDTGSYIIFNKDGTGTIHEGGNGGVSLDMSIKYKLSGDNITITISDGGMSLTIPGFIYELTSDRLIFGDEIGSDTYVSRDGYRRAK